MLELIKFEWKKLCRSRSTIIVTLCCFAGTVFFFVLPFFQFKAWDENGTTLTGKDAVSYRKNVYNQTLPKLLTEERVTNDIEEYQGVCSNPKNLMNERGGDSTLNDKLYYRYFEPRRSYLNMIGNAYSSTNELGSDNLLKVPLNQGAQFYKNWQESIVERIDQNEELNCVEKDYWKRKALSVPVPFEYGFALGWANFGLTVEMLILCMLGICISISPVFSGEYRMGTAPIILSTRYGKSKVIKAKIISALIFSSIVFLLNALTALALPLLAFGAEGGRLPIQIASIFSPYNLSFKEASLLCILVTYIVMLGLVCMTLFLSAKLNSPFSVLIVILMVMVIPMFLPFNKATALLPSFAIQGTSIFEYEISFSAGDIVVNYLLMIVIVYLVISAIFLPLAARNFKRHVLV